jgi:hypothetical protein
MLAIWGLVIYHWRGLENSLPTAYYTPHIYFLNKCKTKTKQNM